uniref:RNA helicase n=1 Tax=Astyanax mexicanus TaxID=7994 RepID=W5LHS4_ASTMX
MGGKKKKSASLTPAAAAAGPVNPVVIQSDLEKKIIKLINDHRQENGDNGPISGRLTTKKLLDLYTALQKFRFKTEHIEEAMKSSMLYGGDLHSALDWLCLNLKDVKKKKKSESVNMKEWILRYAQQEEEESSEEEEEEEERKSANGSRNPELSEKFDPNERYLLLTAQLYDAKETAADAKTKKDKTGQRTAQDRIRVIQQEMKPLESHPLFNPAIKVTDTPKEEKKEKKAAPVKEQNEDLNFNLFEQAEKQPAEKSENRKKKEQKDVRDFDYTGRSWTGKSPKQFLIDWCRKNLPKSPPPSFQKVPAGRHWRCKCVMFKLLCTTPHLYTDTPQVPPLTCTLIHHSTTPPLYTDTPQVPPLTCTTDTPHVPPLTCYTDTTTGTTPHCTLIPPQVPPLHLYTDTPQPAEPEDSWESLAGPDDAQEVQSSLREVRQWEEARSLYLSRRGSALALKLRSEREQLPVFQHRGRVLETLRRHRVVVVAGETGSGKSTQIPQFILEDLLTGEKEARPCNIAVTQPRRISAMSLASRVSQELGSEDGPGGRDSLCGYQIRMENRSSDSTRLLYCTTGVLLRKLQQDRLLSSLTHIIVDEVHERSVQSDFLLTILRDVVHKRSDLQLILMSATVDCDKFSAYFNRCPVVSIPGRTFPVEVFHLEDIVEETGYVLEEDSDYSQRFVEEEEEVSVSVTQKGGKTLQHQEMIMRDSAGWDLGPELDHFSSRTRRALQYMNPNKINMDLILDLLAYLDKSPQFAEVNGAVLVFLPGLAHIQQLYDLLTTDKRFSARDRYKLIALHSTLSSQDQASAFTVPPAGVRKIVLSTNIAETGVTIPDVVFVIDTGRTKENRYHESSQMSSLVETFVSKASALQRQGRAGRVRSGFCFRLYPKFRFNSFIDYSKPEILRVPLEELCLHIMKCEYGSPEEFLSRALDAPQQQAVCNAVGLLRKIGACEQETHTLTPLGHHLAALPVNVKIGKMLIFGAILGCLEPIATVAAAMSEKSPFSTPMSRKEEANLARDVLAVADSDHLTIYNAYLGWRNARIEGTRTEMSYCRKHFLNRTALITIENVKQELIRMVEQTGFTRTSQTRSKPKAPPSLSKADSPILAAVLTAGLYDNVGRTLYTPSVDLQERVACSVETAQGKAQVHPSSINRNLQTHGWLLYQEKVKYSKVYLRDTTLISPFPILLFGGEIDVQHRDRLTTVDGWIHFQAPVRIGVIFKHLRKLINSLLDKKLANPKMNLEDEKTIQIIIELIKSENMLR